MTTSTEFSQDQSHQVLPNGDVIRADEEWSPSGDADRHAVESTADLLTALHENGVTYQAIADRLGVNWRTIHRWRNRQTHPATAGLVNVALASMLGMVAAQDYTANEDAERLEISLADAPF